MSDERHKPDDRQFREDFDEVLSRANPNPARIGCLTQHALRALAEREQPLGDPGYEHLLNCSECYRDFRRYQGAKDVHES